MERFYAKHVEQVTGVKRLRLNQWMEKGFITPSIQRASGTGTKNIYSLFDLYSITLFKRLVESGLSRSVTAGFNKLINYELVKSSINKKYYVVHLIVARRFDDDETKISIRFSTGSETIPDAKQKSTESLHEATEQYFNDDYDQVCVLNIVKVIREVDSKIKELST